MWALVKGKDKSQRSSPRERNLLWHNGPRRVKKNQVHHADLRQISCPKNYVFCRAHTTVHRDKRFMRHALQASSEEVLFAVDDDACVPNT